MRAVQKLDSRMTRYIAKGIAINCGILLLFGINGASIIACQAVINVMLSSYIVRETGNRSAWWLLLFGVAVFANQVPYLYGHGGSLVYAFFAALACFFFVTAAFNAASSASDLHSIQESEEIKHDRVYMVIKKPVTITDHILATFGAPASSLSFSYGRTWIKFTKETGMALVYDCRNTEGFVFVDVGSVDKFSEQKFRAVIGERWSLKNNCLTAWRSFLLNSDIEISPLEILPSSYIKRITKRYRNA